MSKRYIRVIVIAIVVIIMSVVFLAYVFITPRRDTMNEILSAKTITIAGEVYPTTEIDSIEFIGNLYDEEYKIILKSGSVIYFKEFKLD